MEYTPIATETINGQPIHVYGSLDEPLFHSTTLGQIVGTTQPSVIIKDFKGSERVNGKIRTDNRTVNGTFLTRAGTRKFFMKVGQEIPAYIGKYIDQPDPVVNHGELLEAPIAAEEDVAITAPEAFDPRVGTAFVGDLLRDMFNDREVRVLGTINDPLFVARDIGDILGIVDIISSIKHFDESERTQGQILTNNGPRNAVLLTEEGLYRLLGASNKPEARPFQKWVVKVIKEVRLKGVYDIRADMNRVAHDVQHVPQHAPIDHHPICLEREDEHLLSLNRPTITYPQCDINDYIDDPCIYLLHLKGCDYKYGKSGEVNIRIETHTREFEKYGCTVRLVKLWLCSSMKIMNRVEKTIKTYARHAGISVEKYDQTEILATDDIYPVVLNIDKYVERENGRCEKVVDLERLKLETARIQAETAMIQAQAERERIALERECVVRDSYRPRTQLEPPRSIPQYIQPPPIQRTIAYPPPIHKPFIMINHSLPKEPLAVDIPVAQPPAIQPAPIAIPASLKQQNRVKVEKTRCECGKMVSPTNKTHLTSTKHTTFMAQKNER